MRDQVRRKRTHPRNPMGPRRREPPDDHFDARTQRLSLPRRSLQQPHRPLQNRRRRSELVSAERLLGAAVVIAALQRAYAAFRGFDDETGSVPMMDGPLRPNGALDAAPAVLTLPGVDNLLAGRDGLLCSSGSETLRLARSTAAL